MLDETPTDDAPQDPADHAADDAVDVPAADRADATGDDDRADATGDDERHDATGDGGDAASDGRDATGEGGDATGDEEDDATYAPLEPPEADAAVPDGNGDAAASDDARGEDGDDEDGATAGAGSAGGAVDEDDVAVVDGSEDAATDGDEPVTAEAEPTAVAPAVAGVREPVAEDVPPGPSGEGSAGGATWASQDLTGDPFGAGGDQDPLPRPTPRAVVQSFGMLAAAVLVGVLAVMPAPYAVNGPGPTTDVLGEVDGSPLIEVDGAPTYPSSGELRLTTISGVGGPGYPAYLLNVLQGWVSRSSVVQPVEAVYPQDATREEIAESNAGLMVSSQENAAVAALVELGYEVPATLVVAGTVEGTDAAGKLEEGDVITALDGEVLADYQSLVARLAETEPGATVGLTVRRYAQDVEIDVVTGENEDGGARIGVYVDPSFDMPVDVSINIEGVGGPSAGTMFALGLVDLLTPEDEAAGQVIAGTGTIDVTGAVGPIGGIRQKLAGAVRDGATWFLAPAKNCDAVVGHVPRGLRVVRIATLHEARVAMEAIGAGEVDDLPTCTAE